MGEIALPRGVIDIGGEKLFGNDAIGRGLIFGIVGTVGIMNSFLGDVAIPASLP